MFVTKDEAEVFAHLRDRVLGYPRVTREGTFETAAPVERRGAGWTTLALRDAIREALPRRGHRLRLEYASADDPEAEPVVILDERARLLELLELAEEGGVPAHTAARDEVRSRAQAEAAAAALDAEAARLAAIEAFAVASPDELLAAPEVEEGPELPPEYHELRERYPEIPDDLVRAKALECAAIRNRGTLGGDFVRAGAQDTETPAP